LQSEVRHTMFVVFGFEFSTLKCPPLDRAKQSWRVIETANEKNAL
jgi:hypothetical protein